MVDLKLYEAQVVDIDDKDKQGKIKIRILPEHKDVQDNVLPWAIPFLSIMSNKEFENDLVQKDSIVYVLVDPLFKRFYYISNKFFYTVFKYSTIENTLSKASEISNKEYKNIKFRLYEDGGLEFHNKQDGSHGFIHKSGSYTIFDKDGNIYLNSNLNKIKIYNTMANLKDMLDNIYSVLINLCTPGNLIGNNGAPVVYTQATTDLTNLNLDKNKLSNLMK